MGQSPTMSSQSPVIDNGTQRHWFKNEIQFVQRQPAPSVGAQAKSIASGVSVDQTEALAIISDLSGEVEYQWDGQPLVATVSASSLPINAVQDDAFANGRRRLVRSKAGSTASSRPRTLHMSTTPPLAFEDRSR